MHLSGSSPNIFEYPADKDQINKYDIIDDSATAAHNYSPPTMIYFDLVTSIGLLLMFYNFLPV